MNINEVPRTPEEVSNLLDIVNRQEKQIRGQNSSLFVTCAGCGNMSQIYHMYHCYHCGLWLCSVCSLIHFGRRPKGALMKSVNKEKSQLEKKYKKICTK